MKKKNNQKRMQYDPESDILMLELTAQVIDYAKEIGNVIIHFTANNMPVLIEVLDASNLFKQAMKIFSKDESKAADVEPKPVLQSEQK